MQINFYMFRLSSKRSSSFSLNPLLPALFISGGVQKKTPIPQGVGRRVHSTLRNSPAVIGKDERNIMNIWWNTFLVENDLSFQNGLCPHDFKIIQASCLHLKWKRYKCVTNASSFMTSFFIFPHYCYYQSFNRILPL